MIDKEGISISMETMKAFLEGALTPEEVIAEAVLEEPALDKARLIALRGQLVLEANGMRGRSPTALSLVRQEFGIKASTSKQALPLFEAVLEGKGIKLANITVHRLGDDDEGEEE